MTGTGFQICLSNDGWRRGWDMDKLWTAAFCFLTMAEYVSFYVVVFGRRVQVAGKKAFVFGISTLALVLACLGWQEWLLDFRRVWLFVYCAIAIFSLFSLPFRENVKLFLESFAALTLMEGIFDCFVMAFGDFEPIVEMNIYAAGVLMLLWGYYFIFAGKGTRDIFGMSARFKVVAAVMVYILALMMNFISWFLIESSFGGGLKYLGLFVACGSIASCILLFALIYYFNGTQNYSMQVQILEKQNEQQREYFEQLLKKEQDTRQFRHDLISELLELKSYSERGEYAKLDDYLAEMLGEISGISERQYDVGNDIVNTIVNYYLLPIRNSCNIKVKGYMEEEQTVSQRDLCILVSNLVKNAVEAVEKVQTRQRKILFEVCQGKKALNIRVENTVEGEIKIRGGFPITMKEDKKNHGLGILNVKTIVERYQGNYTCKVEKNWFVADVFLEM